MCVCGVFGVFAGDGESRGSSLTVSTSLDQGSALARLANLVVVVFGLSRETNVFCLHELLIEA